MRRGLSQRDLARLLGITPGAICNWEKGIRGPSDRRLAGIAKKLHVPIDELLSESEGRMCTIETRLLKDLAAITKRMNQIMATASLSGNLPPEQLRRMPRKKLTAVHKALLAKLEIVEKSLKQGDATRKHLKGTR